MEYKRKKYILKKKYIDRRYGMEHLTYCQCAFITCNTKTKQYGQRSDAETYQLHLKRKREKSRRRFLVVLRTGPHMTPGHGLGETSIMNKQQAFVWLRHAATHSDLRTGCY